MIFVSRYKQRTIRMHHRSSRESTASSKNSKRMLPFFAPIAFFKTNHTGSFLYSYKHNISNTEHSNDQADTTNNRTHNIQC